MAEQTVGEWVKTENTAQSPADGTYTNTYRPLGAGSGNDFAAFFSTLSTGITSIAQTRQELARAGQLRFNAEQAKTNAQLATFDLENLARAGEEERDALRQMERMSRGSARASFAGGNIAVDEGTPLEFDIAQAEQFSRERSRSRREEASARTRLTVERQSLLAQARLGRSASRRATGFALAGQAAGIAGSFA